MTVETLRNLSIINSNIKIFGFPCCSTWKPFHWCINNYCYCRTDIGESTVISALQHKSKFNFDLFWKEKKFFGLPWYSTREDLSIDVSITNVGLILTKLGWFLGYGQTDRWKDRPDFGIRIWKHVCRHTTRTRAGQHKCLPHLTCKTLRHLLF